LILKVNGKNRGLKIIAGKKLLKQKAAGMYTKINSMAYDKFPFVSDTRDGPDTPFTKFIRWLPAKLCLRPIKVMLTKSTPGFCY